MKLFYIGTYNSEKSCINRKYAPSAQAKMDYLISAFLQTGLNVTVLSLALPIDSRPHKTETVQQGAGILVKHIPSLGGWGFLPWGLRALWINICIFFMVPLHVKKNDIAVVYHRSGFSDTIVAFWKKILGFHLVLEVEEVYQNLNSLTKAKKRAERSVFKKADAYIFPTEYLNDSINKTCKPFAIVYGTYKVNEKLFKKFDDDKIHVVYAGTFDPKKGGAAAAIGAAEFLPSNYHIHICGFGTDKETSFIVSLVEDIKQKSGASLSYEGLLQGGAYEELLQKCEIGLSTQNPEAKFNLTSFPSKILSYMSNGLRVVSINIPPVFNATIAPLISFYDEQTPENIAKAIMNVDLCKDYDSRKLLGELNDQFVKEMKDIIDKRLT